MPADSHAPDAAADGGRVVVEGGIAAEPEAGARRGERTLPDLGFWGPVLALVVLCVLLSIFADRFATGANLKAIADQASVPAVLAVGLTFVIVMGAIDLSIEGIMAAAAIITALLVANERNSLDLGLLGVALAVLAGVVLGFLNGIINARLRVPSFMVTLGMGSIGLGIATVLFGDRPPKISDPSMRAWGLDEFLGLPRYAFVALAIVTLGYVIQRYTRMGRYAFAIGGGEDLARLSGLRVERYKTIVFTFAGAMFALGGAMSAARVGIGSPTAGNGQLFATITAVVVGGTLLSGGRGGVLHSTVGVLIVTVLGNGLVLLGVDDSIQRAVQGAIIVSAVALTTWPARGRLRVIK
jgi:ribose transport system permease protein